MTVALRILRLDSERWTYVSPASILSAAAVATAASVLLALNRFGGLLIDAPRAFLRMALVGVYGWLGLAVGVWLLTTGLRAESAPATSAAAPATFQQTLAATGLAHVPILTLGLVVFVAANLFQFLGPGFAVAVFVFVFWFPAVLVSAVRYTNPLSLTRSMAVVVVPYVLWLSLVGRHLLGQINHLL